MKIIKPHTILNSELTSNVTITETLWTAGTYSLGDQRYTTTAYNLYEVIVASTSDSPEVGVLADPPTWKLVGKINRWKMFDQIVGTQTENTSSIEITLDTSSLLNGIALFGLSGTTVQIIMTETTEGVVYDQTINLVETSAVYDWYTYFFEPIDYILDIVKTDLPAYSSSATIDIIVSGTGTVKVGELVAGQVYTFGEDVALGSGFGTIDYSRKTTDENGNFIIEERPFAKRADFLVQVEKYQLASIQKLLTNIRTVPAVFVGSDSEEYFIIYGFYRDFFAVVSTPTLNSFNLSVEGLI